MHIDPKHLQKYILNSGWFGVKEGNVTDLDTVDADVILIAGVMLIKMISNMNPYTVL